MGSDGSAQIGLSTSIQRLGTSEKAHKYGYLAQYRDKSPETAKWCGVPATSSPFSHRRTRDHHHWIGGALLRTCSLQIGQERHGPIALRCRKRAGNGPETNTPPRWHSPKITCTLVVADPFNFETTLQFSSRRICSSSINVRHGCPGPDPPRGSRVHQVYANSSCALTLPTMFSAS